MKEFRVDITPTECLLYHEDQVICKLIYIPQGSFKRNDGKIICVNAFYMARFAVTQELYETVTGNNPSRFKGKQHPVESVSWNDAVKFCGILNNGLKDYKPILGSQLLEWNNLNDKELDKFVLNSASPGFRLPTEAEWEYAAKGNKGNFDPANEVFDYAGSNQLDMVGWYDGNNYSETKPVGLLFPNQFGLYDLSGNVWEWCWDWYADYDNRLNNPVGAKSGSIRVVRGGSWFPYAVCCRSVLRNSYTPGFSDFYLGLRLLFVP